jgi:phosphoglycolate phosphatase-like HAD superfamily hydrolase
MANGGISRFEKFKHYHKTFLSQDASEREIEMLSKKFSALVMKKIIEAPLVSGIKTFLKEYSGRYQCFIVSATPLEEIKNIAKEKNIDSYFLKICGSPDSKTKWVQEILKTYCLNPEESLFIGDTLLDYNAAENNNIAFLLRCTLENGHLFSMIDGVESIDDFTNFQHVLDKI